MALSECEGERNFHVNWQSATNSLNAFTTTAAPHWQTAKLASLEQDTVSTRTAESICAEFEIGRFDIMKVDVRGAEHEVLLGAEKMLQAGAVRLLQLEFFLANTYAGQQPLHDYLAFPRCPDSTAWVHTDPAGYLRTK